MKHSYSFDNGNENFLVKHPVPLEAITVCTKDKNGTPCLVAIVPCPTELKEVADGQQDQQPDPWSLPELNQQDEGEKKKAWSELNGKQRARTICVCAAKTIALLALLYSFIYSLDILSKGFQLLGGRTVGAVFQDSQLLRNPVFGLMIGVLATVLVQSSSTSTSIVVSMVASEILTVRTAIPIIMGANIGTSMTNTLVSVAHSGDRAQFRRAFAGATVHDMFNWLTVLILLPLEAAFGYLYYLSTAVIDSMNLNVNGPGKELKLLSAMTEPLTKLTIQLDKSIIEDLATGKLNESEVKSLVKRDCNGKRCAHIFSSFDISDTIVGIIILVASLAILIGCLICIVKLLSSVLRGRVINIVHKTVNAELPGRWSFITGYLAIVVGAITTLLVQSSSVFTSALTPLVGLGVLSVERMYPLTLGSNIGTTCTSILAAFAGPSRTLSLSLQISFCHLFFNLSGILLFYPIPYTRRIPIALAKMMGETTGQYRWFAVVYVLIAFCLLPASVFGLSLLGNLVLLCVGAPVAALLAIIITVNIVQRKYPAVLPASIRTWDWLPIWMHSLEPYDRLITSCCSSAAATVCCCCARGEDGNGGGGCCAACWRRVAPATGGVVSSGGCLGGESSLASSDSTRKLVNISNGNSRAESPVRYYVAAGSRPSSLVHLPPIEIVVAGDNGGQEEHHNSILKF